MQQNSNIYQTYIEILKRELVCAMGCTEPIAIAYCAAVARATLGVLPDRIEIEASGNIIKNVKSVVVPNTNGGRGIEVAAAIGVLGGDENAQLEVISHISSQVKEKLQDFLFTTPITVIPSISEYLLDIAITVHHGDSYAKVRTVNEHTNIVLIECNGNVILRKDISKSSQSEVNTPNYRLLSVKDIYDFAITCNIEDVKPILHKQIELNCAIADEGLRHEYGANIGKTLLRTCGDDIRTRAKAYAAAGSDARMNGCELPVVINSGSGNQGLTASLPVIIYARELKATKESLYRALLISNLITIHEKTSIGRLSAYCGAVSAGAGAGAGIAFLCGGNDDDIAHTIVNALAITSGIVCDGAKSSCAAKIAMAVEAGIFGYEMYQNGQQFYAGDGLVCKGVEFCIQNFGRLGRIGMRETDHEILRIMTER